MGNCRIIPIIYWAMGLGFRWYASHVCLLPFAQLFLQGLRVGTVKWNNLLGACVPTGFQAEYMFLLGAFSIYSAERAFWITYSTLNVWR